MDLTGYPVRRADVETYIMPDGSSVLFDPREGEGFTLNPAGALVWDYCDGARTPDEIAHEVGGLLPNEPTATQDSLALVKSLLAAGLIALESNRASTPPSDEAL